MLVKYGKEKRCIIVLFYDRDGIVDTYFLELLKQLRPETNNLIVVCNGWVKPESFSKLEEYTDEVILRVNQGFDVGAYREILFYLGWKTLSTFEEVILLNYTFFVMKDSFHTMFETMDQRDIDFWGITKHHKMPNDPYGDVYPWGYMPEHLNSHFIAMRRSLFNSLAYRNFIFNLPNPSSRQESVVKYETIFTKTFSDLGYVYDTYTDSDFLEGIHYFPGIYGIDRLLEKKNCPIIKRRVFYTDYLEYIDKTAGEASAYAYEWLKRHPEAFDMNLMWDNILRLENLADITQTLHLRFFPDSMTTEHEFSDAEALIVVHGPKILFDLFYVSYEKNLPAKWEWLYVEGSLSDALKQAAMSCGKYSYVFFINLLDPKQWEPYSNGVSLIYRDMENLCGSGELVGNLMEEFIQNERLGMLVPPLPNHGMYYEKVQDGRAGYDEKLQEVCQKLGLRVQVRKSAAPPVYSWTGSFWIRSKLLIQIMETYDISGIEDFVVHMLMPLLLQEMGYFTGVVMSTQYASLEATNLGYMMREVNRAVFERVGPDYYWKELVKLEETIK